MYLLYVLPVFFLSFYSLFLFLLCDHSIVVVDGVLLVLPSVFTTYFSYRRVFLNMNMHCRYADAPCTAERGRRKHLCILCTAYYYRNSNNIYFGWQVTAKTKYIFRWLGFFSHAKHIIFSCFFLPSRYAFYALIIFRFIHELVEFWMNATIVLCIAFNFLD